MKIIHCCLYIAVISIALSLLSGCSSSRYITAFTAYEDPISLYDDGINQDYNEIEWSNLQSVARGALHIDTAERLYDYSASSEKQFHDKRRAEGYFDEEALYLTRDQSKNTFYWISFEYDALDQNRYAFIFWSLRNNKDSKFLVSTSIKEDEKWKSALSSDYLPRDVNLISELADKYESLPQDKDFYKEEIRKIRQQASRRY